MSSVETLKGAAEFVTYAMRTFSPTPACTSFTKSVSCGLLLALVEAVSGVDINLPSAFASASSTSLTTGSEAPPAVEVNRRLAAGGIRDRIRHGSGGIINRGGIGTFLVAAPKKRGKCEHQGQSEFL